MDYDFDLKTVAPIIHGLLTQEPREEKPLLLLTEQPVISEQPPQESQEQMGGAEMVNRSVAPAIPQPPNSLQTGLRRGLLTAKNKYENANTDTARQAAQSMAESYRNQGTVAGIDLSEYGSDVSLVDATKNFESQQARDIMAAMQGYYSRDSKQYYNDKYVDLLKQGYSPRQSRKFAEALAGDYQADRVSYLEGLLNSYGRNGYVTNDIGAQAIGAMGVEGSPLANFYSQFYPTAKEAYNRANTLEDTGIKNQHELDLLGVGLKNDLKKIEAQTAGNIKYGQAQAGWQKERDAQLHKYDKENAYDKYRYSTYLANNQGKINADLAKLNGAITQQNQAELEEMKHKLGIETKEYDFLLADRKWQQQIVQLSSLADYFGHEGDSKKAFMQAALGIKMPDPNTGKFDKASVENGKKFHDMLDADEKNILKQIENLGFDADPQEVAELQGKLADIRATKQQLEDMMSEQIGMQTPKRSVREFSDDETANNETLSYLWSRANGDMETYRQYVSNWLDASGVTARFKEQYLNALKAPQ